MALLFLNQLGESALAQVDTSIFHSAAYNSLTVTSGCSATQFAGGDANVLNAAHALGAQNLDNYDVPTVLEFASSASAAESSLAGFAFSNVQPFSSTVFQALVPADAIATNFDDTFRANNQLLLAEQVSTGAKLSAAFVNPASIAFPSSSKQIVAEIVDGSAAPDISSVLTYLGGGCPQTSGSRCSGYTVPSCFGTSSNSTTTLAGTSVTQTAVSSTRTVYTFLSTTTAEDVVYFASLVANEPNVLFVEPVLQAVVLEANPESDLGIPRGDAANVAEGFGVSGVCGYLSDRDIDGSDEIVAIFDDGLDAASLFFSSPSDTELPCFGVDPSLEAATGCCRFATNCTNYDAACEATCTEGATNPIATPDSSRRVKNYIPVADGFAAAHGTKVASTVVGSLYESRSVKCSDSGNYSADGVAGVAAGATTVFVDIGSQATGDLEVPATSFGTSLQEFAYNLGANEVVLAWGASSSGASDAITRDIDSFLTSNNDAVVVAAAGNSGSNVNTALSKNGISAGVFAGDGSSTTNPDVSVQFVTPLLAANSGSNDATDFCEVDTFAGSSAAAAIVAGQVAVTEQYLKVYGSIFAYNGTGSETVEAGSQYSGATLKALLVASASNEGVAAGNGAGVPVLERVLPFEDEHQRDLRIEQHTFTSTGSRSRTITVTDASKPLVVTLAYTDTAPAPFATSGNGVVNDVRLTVTSPSQTYSEGVTVYPAGSSATSAANNVQKIIITVPEEGDYVINVDAAFLSSTAAADQTVSVVVSGRFSVASSDTVTGQDAGEVTAVPACCPYGTLYPTTSCFPITFLVLIVVVVFAFGLVLICIFRAKCKVKDVHAAA